jgi:hypothetical protein
MVNNLINYNFYDIKKRTSVFSYTLLWHDLCKTNIDAYWDFENSVADANHSYNNSSNSLWQSYNEGNTSYESYQVHLFNILEIAPN